MITCSDAVRQLWEYVESELDPVDREQVDEHLAFCRRCCGEIEFAEELRRFMSRRPVVDLPSAIAARFNRLLAELDSTGAP